MLPSLRLSSYLLSILAYLYFCIGIFADASQLKETIIKQNISIGISQDDMSASKLTNRLCDVWNYHFPYSRCNVIAFKDAEQTLQHLNSQMIHFAVVPELNWLPVKNKLTVLLPLYQISFTLIGHLNADLNKLSQLKLNNIGVLSRNPDDFKLAEALILSTSNNKNSHQWIVFDQAQTMIQAFCDGELEGVLLVTPHPDRRTLELTTACDGKILPIMPKIVRQLVKDIRAYGYQTIPNIYWKMSAPLTTLGGRNLLITHTHTPKTITQTMMSHLWALLQEESILPMANILAAYQQSPLPLAPEGMAIIKHIQRIEKTFSTTKQKNSTPQP